MKANSKRLMEGLSGRNTFSAVMMNYLASLQGNAAPFSDADIERALERLNHKPGEYRAYHRWVQFEPFIQLLQAECRVAAIAACWQLSLVVTQLRYRQDKNENLQPLLAKLRCNVRGALRCWVALQVIGEALGVKLHILAAREMNRLEQSVALYNRAIELEEEKQALQNGEAISEALPRLSMEPDSIATPGQCREMKEAMLAKQWQGEIESALDALMNEAEAEPCS